MTGEIHEGHPFRTPEDLRDPARRFRGRLVAPVTIVTSQGSAGATGLTVSSLMVAEGDPAKMYLLVGPATDLYDAITASRRFVVHILGSDDQRISDVFAGLRPSPGGLFTDLVLEESSWGPVIASIGDRAFCTVDGAVEESFVALITATIDAVAVAEFADPLVYFRGSYRRLG